VGFHFGHQSSVEETVLQDAIIHFGIVVRQRGDEILSMSETGVIRKRNSTLND
jgi:hypothetical protein